MAVDFNGKMAWHNAVGDLNNYHGSAGSPDPLQGPHLHLPGPPRLRRDQSFVAALRQEHRQADVEDRPRRDDRLGHAVVIRAGDRDELIVSSQRKVYGYDPAHRQRAVDGRRAHLRSDPDAGRGRRPGDLLLRPAGSDDRDPARRQRRRHRDSRRLDVAEGSPFVPSGVVVDGVLYLVNDMQSILTAHDVKTGQVALPGPARRGEEGRFSASPIAHDGKVFFTNDDGETFVLQAGREFKLLHVNQLGEQTLASPALVDGRWYFRTASSLLAIE